MGFCGQCQDLPQTLLLVGKLADQGCVSAVSHGILVIVKDDISNRPFLCDTRSKSQHLPSPIQLSAIWSTSPWAGRPADSLLGRTRADPMTGPVIFPVNFPACHIQFPILGMDFFKHYQLLVDPVVWSAPRRWRFFLHALPDERRVVFLPPLPELSQLISSC
jgi:hypothetical protein